VNLGRKVSAVLTGSPAVTDRLSVRETARPEARYGMDRGKAYVTVLIPPGFTRSALGIAGPAPEVQLLTNPRAGTLGVSLALGVLQPALRQTASALGQPAGPAATAAV